MHISKTKDIAIDNLRIYIEQYEGIHRQKGGLKMYKCMAYKPSFWDKILSLFKLVKISKKAVIKQHIQHILVRLAQELDINNHYFEIWKENIKF